jgi:hypothetical protein
MKNLSSGATGLSAGPSHSGSVHTDMDDATDCDDTPVDAADDRWCSWPGMPSAPSHDVGVTVVGALLGWLGDPAAGATATVVAVAAAGATGAVRRTGEASRTTASTPPPSAIPRGE